MTKLAEQFIKEYTRGISNEIENGCYHEWLTPEQAISACIIERNETINKACEWLEDNIYDYLYINRDFNEADYKNELIEDLRKAMEQ